MVRVAGEVGMKQLVRIGVGALILSVVLIALLGVYLTWVGISGLIGEHGAWAVFIIAVVVLWCWCIGALADGFFE